MVMVLFWRLVFWEIYLVDVWFCGKGIKDVIYRFDFGSVSKRFVYINRGIVKVV